MEARPPKVAERIAELLIPPACREQVLGDLAERFTTTPRYLGDVLSIVPYVVASGIRRNWNPQLTLLEAVAIFVSYAGALFLLGTERRGMMEGIGLAVGLTTCALIIAGVYAPRRKRVPHGQVLFASLACVLLLMLVNPLHSAVWVLGGVLCALLISLGRAWRQDKRVAAIAGAEAPRLDDSLEQRVRTFELRIRRRNLREYVAAAAVIVFFSIAVQRSPSPSLQVSCVLIICGALFNMVHLYRRGASRRIPETLARDSLVDFYRSELTRQRDLLRNVWAWAMIPMLPGLIAYVISISGHGLYTPFIIMFLALILLLMRSANRHAAFELQREIENLE